MLSKNDIKHIRSLELKKHRQAADAFVAEGPKLIGELLAAGVRPQLIVTSDASLRVPDGVRMEVVSDAEVERCSLLRSPQGCVGIFPILPHEKPGAMAAKENIVLALDSVQDPGNLGTIVRLADWFGIEHVVCSEGCADIYNPKTVQATMGAIARVKVHYTDLERWIADMKGEVDVYGTFLDGETIGTRPLGRNGIVVMGNEGRGISSGIRRLVTRKLFIPPYPADGSPTVESLNVGIATAIVCHEFRRG